MKNVMKRAALIAGSCLLAGIEIFLIVVITANFSPPGGGIG